MSKIGQYNLELQEQANEYGFDTTQEALDNDFKVAYGDHTAYLYRDDGQADAHEAWLKEKAEVIGDLNNMLIGLSAAGKSDTTEFGIIQHAIKFINNGEM